MNNLIILLYIILYAAQQIYVVLLTHFLTRGWRQPKKQLHWQSGRNLSFEHYTDSTKATKTYSSSRNIGYINIHTYTYTIQVAQTLSSSHLGLQSNCCTTIYIIHFYFLFKYYQFDFKLFRSVLFIYCSLNFYNSIMYLTFI